MPGRNSTKAKSTRVAQHVPPSRCCVQRGTWAHLGSKGVKSPLGFASPEKGRGEAGGWG